MKKRYLLPLLLIFYTLCLQAQSLDIDWSAFNSTRIDHQQKAMLVLGAWAVGNIAFGGLRSSQTSGQLRYFHQMNMYWNVVNLGIASLGYYGAANEDFGSYSAYQSAAKHYSFQKVLLFNAGLDVGYMLGGLYLQERSKRPELAPNKSEQLKGFGQAVLLQGGFLLAFDLVNYFISASADPRLELLLQNPQGPALGLSWTF